jgi:hypothetical protein
MIIATVVIASIVVVIIMSIPIVVAMIGPAVAVITSIRSTVTDVVMSVAVLVIIVVALGFLGFGVYSEGMLQLLALPQGVFGIAVELTLVIHDHVEVTLEEGGRPWWVCHIGFTRSLACPVSTVVMIYCIQGLSLQSERWRRGR